METVFDDECPKCGERMEKTNPKGIVVEYSCGCEG